jgi:hypothetical protein
MILLSYGFTFAVALAVIILLVAAVTAIWEKLRDGRELEKPQRERRSPTARAAHRIGSRSKTRKRRQ